MFDIILPVRNRFKTFEKTYNSCISFMKSDSRLKDTKIIIIDNNSNDIPQKFISKLHNCVKYLRFSKTLPMNQSWQMALSSLSNKYFTYIGSDDALIFNKDSIDKIFMNDHVDCFFWHKYSYFWDSALYQNSKPSFSFPINYYQTGLISTSDILNDVFNGETAWNMLPTVYNSFLSKRIVEKFESINSQINFFWNIPDISSGMNVLNMCKNVFYLENGLGISGVSKFSNGYNCLKKVKTEETTEFDRFNKNFEKQLSTIKNVYSHPQTITAEIFIKSLSFMNYKYIENLSLVKDNANFTLINDVKDLFNPYKFNLKSFLINLFIIPNRELKDIEILSKYLNKLFLKKNKFFFFIDRSLPSGKVINNKFIKYINFLNQFLILTLSRIFLEIETYLKRR